MSPGIFRNHKRLLNKHLEERDTHSSDEMRVCVFNFNRRRT